MTVKQTQCLLMYLGYDTGGADGVAGAKTAAALADVQARYGVGAEGLVGIIAGTVAPRDFWGDVRHFRREEFRCRCGQCGGYPVEPVEKLVRMVDDVREHFGVPGTISSGVRCGKHNAAVGGVANSRHLLGCAADVCFSGVSPKKVLAYVRQHPSCAYAYEIMSEGKSTGYVHMDVIV